MSKATGAEIGTVTSGCPSPSLGANVAMAYVETKFAKVGTEVLLKVGKRNTEVPARLAKMPFVKTNYFKG